MRIFNFFLTLCMLHLSNGSILAQTMPDTDNYALGSHCLGTKFHCIEENKGQVIDLQKGEKSLDVKYRYADRNLAVFFLPTGLAYQFCVMHHPKGERVKTGKLELEGSDEDGIPNQHLVFETFRMDMELQGSNPNPEITADGRSLDYINYYNHDVLDVHSFTRLTYHEVYPGIDWVIFPTEKGLKYEFIVRPRGNPSQIRMQYFGVDSIMQNVDGGITLSSSMGFVNEEPPVSFHADERIPTTFVVEEDVVRFLLAGFDSSKVLTIDPGLEWATYYGGASEDQGFACTTDLLGNVYVAGLTSSLSGIAALGHQSNLGGDYDAMLVKFNSSGSREWGTYYGGALDDFGWGATTDQFGNAYLSGYTFSAAGIAFGGHQDTLAGGSDAFLVKFSPNGYRQWGTYYGGLSSDYGMGCSSDSTGSIYLAGYTSSSSGIAYGGYQNFYSGNSDCFLVKFNGGGSRLWATYYGGTAGEADPGCTTDLFGNVYLVGNTSSTTDIASNGHQNSYGGGAYDAFLAKFDSLGNRQWATYYGGSGVEYGIGACTVDRSGNVYLTAGTASTTSISYSGHQNFYGGGSRDGLLVKFSGSGQRLWATYYGGNNYDVGKSCVVDNYGYIYLAGSTVSNSSIAFGGYQSVLGGSSDAFLAKFDSAGVRQWGTYFGGTSSDDVYSCSIDPFGSVYLAGVTYSNNGIALGGYQITHGGGMIDAFLAKLEPCSQTDSAFAHSTCSSFVLNNQTYTSSGTYTQVLTNAVGCDSVITLDLTILQPSGMVLVQSACDSFNLNNQTYTSSGTYTQLLANSVGCDSTITLDLTILQPSSVVLVQSACDSFNINNQIYTSSGTYTQVLTNSVGCDSVITLGLTILQPSGMALVQSACDGYNINNQTYTSSGTYTQVLTNSAGCDSVITLDLTILHSSGTIIVQSACDSFNFNNQTYAESGIYTQVLTNSSGCDSFITLDLTISSLIATIALNGDTLVASPVGVSYQWVDCENGIVPIPGATNGYFIPTVSGSYAVIVSTPTCTDTSVCQALVGMASCRLCSGIEVFPIPFNSQIDIHLNQPIESLEMNLFNSQGRLIKKMAITNLHNRIDLSQQASGMYLLVLSATEEYHVIRIVKE